MSSPLFRPQALSIYLLFFALGAVGALVIPSFSLFLAEALGVRPLLVGLPFAGIALASIGYNHWIGHWSDQRRDRRPLIAGFCLLGALACMVFALSRNYLLVTLTAVLIFSLAMVAYSQLLAFSLDYAELFLPLERIPLFNAIVRAQIAFAWVVGPPLGFLLATRCGFAWAYGAAAGVFLVVGLACLKFLPQLPARVRHSTLDRRDGAAEIPAINQALSPAVKRSLALCVLGFSLLWGVNNAYLISLPLHLKNDLQLDPSWMGWVMGTTAALEVPFMLLAGHYAARVALIQLIRAAGLAALLLYLGVYWADQLWQLFALQLCNAVFIGLLAGLGVSVVQDLLPGRSGVASALYTNTTHIGNLLSSLMVGVVADALGYHQVFLVNVVLVIVAIWAFGQVKSARALGAQSAD